MFGALYARKLSDKAEYKNIMIDIIRVTMRLPL